MPIPIAQIDAFTDTPFSGNPAAVCLLAESRDDRWLQAVAREMNLAETAFLLPMNDGYRLRWFTPTIEVDLCGHATLASAHLLWEDGHLAPDDTARFHTRSGLLTAARHDGWITLDFPATPAELCPPPPGLSESVGAPVLAVGRSQFDYLVEVESEEVVRALQPNFDAISRLPARGLIVTGRSTRPGFDFVSRFFAPQSGIAEDPVTGSAHCALGPFWGKRLGKSDLMAFQASPRGGVLRVRLAGDRVLLGGQAVTVLRGELLH
jgi:PhzF family phenazine biosynthesis protein